MNLKKHLSTIIILLLIIVCGIFCFWDLGSRQLSRWDEQTNVDVVSSSLQQGSFPLLRNDKISFFEKPPLWYWITQSIVQVFGINNSTVRIVSAMSGFLLFILILIYCTKYFNKTVAICAGLTFLTTAQLFINNPDNVFSSHFIRSADLDLLQLLFVFSAIFAITTYNKNKKGRYLIVFSVFCGLGIMTKGFAPLLLIALWTLWCVIHFRAKFFSLKDLLLKTSYIIFPLFLIILPWHVYMIFSYGNEFISSYFGYHTISRITTTLEGHNGDWLFYLKLLVNPQIFLSGIVLLASFVWIAIKQKYKQFEYYMLFAFTLGILVFISIVNTKLAWYLLYVYPGGVVLCGALWERLFTVTASKASQYQ